MRRLREFQQQFQDIERQRDEAPLSDKDLDLLEAAKIHSSDFLFGGLAGAAALLRFAGSLQEAELPYVEEFAAGATKQEDDESEGFPMAWSLAFVLVQRNRFDGAAQAIVAQAILVPREHREYGTWKMWGQTYEQREDYHRLTREFVFALLRRYAVGNAEERLAIADILGKKDMTEADLQAMRERIVRQGARQEAERQQQQSVLDKQDADKPAKIWVEDRHGLRLVDRRSWLQTMGSPARHELRFLRRASPDGPARDWGALVSYDSMVDLAELHDWLRGLAEVAQDPAADLESRVGVISVHVRPPARRDALAERLEALAEALSKAVSTGVVARLAVAWEPAPDAAHGERLGEVARELLAAVRGCASRTAELTSGARRADATDQEGDAAVIEALEVARAHAMALLETTKVFEPTPSAAGSFHDMPFQQTTTYPNSGLQPVPSFRQRPYQNSAQQLVCRGRTRILFAADRVTTAEFEVSRGPDPGEPCHSVHLQSISRQALRGATFAAPEAAEIPGQTVVGRCQLVMTTSLPVAHRWIDLPSDYRAGSLRAMAHARPWIECDTELNRQALIAELQRFAAGDGR